jgi:hypothetical protein
VKGADSDEGVTLGQPWYHALNHAQIAVVDQGAAKIVDPFAVNGIVRRSF